MDAGVVSGLLQRSTRGSLRTCAARLNKGSEQEASHRKRLRRRGAVCGVAAPPRCAPASPSSRLLASDPAALATPPTPFFSNLLGDLLDGFLGREDCRGQGGEQKRDGR